MTSAMNTDNLSCAFCIRTIFNRLLLLRKTGDTPRDKRAILRTEETSLRLVDFFYSKRYDINLGKILFDMKKEEIMD